MGIELPAELRDVARRTGTHWPEADEDAMRAAARAWRDAADSVGGLARASDASAQRALVAVEGETGRAARREWDGFIDPESGHLPVCVRECTAAADRLEHAAAQVGAAKVRIVRELVTLAKQLDVAESAVATGNRVSGAESETLVRATAANVAELDRTLVTAVDSGSGVTVEAVDSPVSGIASSGERLSPAGAAPELSGEDPDPASSGVPEVPGVSDVVSDVSGAVDRESPVPPGERPSGSEESGEDTSIAEKLFTRQNPETVPDPSEPVEPAAPDLAPGEHTGSGPPDRESTGPVSAEAIRRADETARGAVAATSGTGPIPGAGSGERAPAADGGGGTGAAGRDPATAPQAVHQAWAASPGGEGQAFPQAAGPGGSAGPLSQAQQPGPAAQHARPEQPPLGGARPQQTGAPPPGTGHPGAGRPPVAGGNPGHGGVAPPGGSAQPPRGFGGTPYPGAAQPGNPPGNPPARGAPPGAAGGAGAPQPPAQPPPQQPSQQQPGDGRRPLRNNERDSAVVAFVLHQFPIGHMPVSSGRPSEQWSGTGGTAEPEPVGFPPCDHPSSHLAERAMFARGDEHLAGIGRDSGTEPEATTHPIPERLLEGYDPLGTDPGLSEYEWELRYGSRGTSDTGGHYDWPARHGCPDNGVEAGEPVVLEPGTVLDRLGDEHGRVLAPEGTSFAARALPPEFRLRPYRRYRVARALPVWRGLSVSWFEQPGGGVRYRATHPVVELVASGTLLELDGAQEPAERATEESTVRLRLETEVVEVTEGDSAEEPNRETG
nr:TNT domain-containing protein [Actinopolyspora biskrensis]